VSDKDHIDVDMVDADAEYDRNHHNDHIGIRDQHLDQHHVVPYQIDVDVPVHTSQSTSKLSSEDSQSTRSLNLNNNIVSLLALSNPRFSGSFVHNSSSLPSDVSSQLSFGHSRNHSHIHSSNSVLTPSLTSSLGMHRYIHDQEQYLDQNLDENQHQSHHHIRLQHPRPHPHTRHHSHTHHSDDSQSLETSLNQQVDKFAFMFQNQTLLVSRAFDIVVSRNRVRVMANAMRVWMRACKFKQFEKKRKAELKLIGLEIELHNTLQRAFTGWKQLWQKTQFLKEKELQTLLASTWHKRRYIFKQWKHAFLCRQELARKYDAVRQRSGKWQHCNNMVLLRECLHHWRLVRESNRRWRREYAMKEKAVSWWVDFSNRKRIVKTERQHRIRKCISFWHSICKRKFQSNLEIYHEHQQNILNIPSRMQTLKTTIANNIKKRVIMKWRLVLRALNKGKHATRRDIETC
jgi:hypothetical protein